MSTASRIANIFYGLVLIALGIVMIVLPEQGYWIIATIMGVSLVVYGIRNIIYYGTMARHMVGGRLVLYFGVLVLDGGALILAFTDLPPFYIMIYLIVLRLLTGVVDILRAMEQKKIGLSAWKRMLVSGIIHVLVAAACAVFIRSADTAVYIYAAGLIYSAINRIITAIHPPKVIVIL